MVNARIHAPDRIERCEVTVKYRKKPVVIEAIQWNPALWSFEVISQKYDELLKWGKGNIKPDFRNSKPCFSIETLEGTMYVDDGDYVIKEPFPTNDRKFYPCKPQIFNATYESAEEMSKLTHKEEFLKGFDGGECWGVDIEVTVPNCPMTEHIINLRANFEGKKAYYEKAYNDDLELISFPQIKIVSYNFR